MTIQTQLLVVVNVTMAVFVATFLVVDYRWQFSQWVADKTLALEEEALTLHQAVQRLQHHGVDAVQQYIDAVCGRMRDSHSPGHHIVVDLQGVVLQAHAHHRSSRDIFEAMTLAARSPQRRAKFREQELVVGSYQQQNVDVYISEYLTNLRTAMRSQIVLRLAGIAVLALVSAAVVNTVMLRLIARPLDRLVGTVRKIAAGELGVKAGFFNSAELSYVAGAINSMSDSLAAADRERRGQMALARRIQLHLLPVDQEVPGLSLAKLYHPADEIAGDYYDILKLSDECWLLCIADVTGHGIPAAMTAGMLKTLLLLAVEHHTDPEQILGFVSRRFAAVALPEDLPTLFLARWDLQARTLQYVSAGHEPVWFLSARGETSELRATGLPLGVSPESIWKTKTLEIAQGDRLLLITDGVVETMNPQSALFGRAHLARLFSQCQSSSLEQLIQRIDQAVKVHQAGRPATDDITVLAAEFTVQTISDPREVEAATAGHTGKSSRANRKSPSVVAEGTTNVT